MRDVIQKVMTTENEAMRIVQAARAAGEQILAQARARSREMVRQAHQEARREAEEILAAAEAEAVRERAENLDLAAAGIKQAIQLDETTARQCVDAAVRCILGRTGETPIVL
jgi:vacuolar-type H+-ATPase subunit H